MNQRISQAGLKRWSDFRKRRKVCERVCEYNGVMARRQGIALTRNSYSLLFKRRAWIRGWLKEDARIEGRG